MESGASSFYIFAQVMANLFIFGLGGFLLATARKWQKMENKTSIRKLVISLFYVVGGILMLAFLLAILALPAQIGDRNDTSPAAASVAPVCRMDASKLLSYINDERSRLGSPALTTDSTLATAAKYKLDDMQQRKYFSHQMPDGKQWYDYVRSLGVTSAISEDLGSNDVTPEQSWKEFKNSPDHYKSLTDPQYMYVGIATQCTDYKIEKAIEPGDVQILGSQVTDLTVVTLASPQ